MHNPVRQMLTSVGQMHTPKFRTNAYSSRTNAYNKFGKCILQNFGQMHTRNSDKSMRPPAFTCIKTSLNNLEIPRWDLPKYEIT